MTQVLTGMRIARISTVPFFVVAQLKQQIATLGAQGAQVTVVASDEPEMSLLQGLEGVRCVPIDIPRSISPWRDLLALIHLYHFFRRERIQIAHSTTPKAGLLTALAAFLAGVPVRLHTFTGQPWVTMSGIKRWLVRTSDKFIGILNTRCYTDSDSQRKFLITQGILSEKRLFVIGAGSLAGVNMRRFDGLRFSTSHRELMRYQLGIQINAPVLLFIGRITLDKGVRELLQAYAEIKMKYVDVHLIFVGRFDPESGVDGEVSHKDLASLPDIHVVGYTECPEEYLAIADILCLPSYREGFGTVVIEAASIEVPTVGTNIYGLTDAVIHGETGLLVPPRDAKSLSEALSLLLRDEALRKKMGVAAKKRVETLFEADLVNKQLIDEYVKLLSSN